MDRSETFQNRGIGGIRYSNLIGSIGMATRFVTVLFTTMVEAGGVQPLVRMLTKMFCARLAAGSQTSRAITNGNNLL